MLPTTSPSPRSRPYAVLWALLSAFALLLVPACGQAADHSIQVTDVTSDRQLGTNSLDGGPRPGTSTGPSGKVDTIAGMPPVVDPNNIYSEAGADHPNANTSGALFRVYVP